MAVEIKNEWLKGFIEALQENKIDFTPKHNGKREYLEVPQLNIMIGPFGSAELASCPLVGNEWDFTYWHAYTYGPLGLGRMIIRKLGKQET